MNFPKVCKAFKNLFKRPWRASWQPPEVNIILNPGKVFIILNPGQGKGVGQDGMISDGFLYKLFNKNQLFRKG